MGSKSTALEVGLESRLRLAALAVAAGWCWMKWGRDNRKVAAHGDSETGDGDSGGGSVRGQRHREWKEADKGGGERGAVEARL